MNRSPPRCKKGTGKKRFVVIWRKGSWVKLNSHDNDIWKSDEKRRSFVPARWAVLFNVFDGEMRYVDERYVDKRKGRPKKRIFTLDLKKHLSRHIK